MSADPNQQSMTDPRSGGPDAPDLYSEAEREPLASDVRARFQPSLEAFNFAIDVFREKSGQPMLGSPQTQALLAAIKRAYEIDAHRVARAIRFGTHHTQPWPHTETERCWANTTICNVVSQAKPMLDALVEDGL